jgi:ech hydrogenase subunit E
MSGNLAGKRTIVPFGPQHPVLPEPIHLDFELEDEKVVRAIPSIGYIHRGLELLTLKREFTEFVFVAERICGICSFIHSMGYCEAVEQIMGIEVPRRAEHLRLFWAELSRIHSHLLWLGLAADAFGFENLFMQTWRAREHLLDIIEATTGGRVIFGSCKVGGVRRDIDDASLKAIAAKLKTIEADVRGIVNVFLNDSSVKQRLCGIGLLSKQEAYELGAVGPMLRASGVEQDMRRLGYSLYGALDFKVITHSDGDCYSRCAVRCAEIFESFSLVRQVIDRMPAGEIGVKVTGAPDGECLARLEQPRGEVAYYIKGDGSKFLSRFRVRTPTFANIPALLKTLEGCDFADVPNIILSIDPCISCTER